MFFTLPRSYGPPWMGLFPEVLVTEDTAQLNQGGAGSYYWSPAERPQGENHGGKPQAGHQWNSEKKGEAAAMCIAVTEKPAESRMAGTQPSGRSIILLTPRFWTSPAPNSESIHSH